MTKISILKYVRTGKKITEKIPMKSASMSRLTIGACLRLSLKNGRKTSFEQQRVEVARNNL